MNDKPLFVQYPSIVDVSVGKQRFSSDPVEFFEKIDGSNCQIRNWGSRVWPGSRSNFLDSRLYDNPNILGSSKRWMANFKRWALRNESLLQLPDDVVVFGEWTSNTPQNMVRYAPNNLGRFFLLDVAKLGDDCEIKEFLEYETAVNFCRKVGLKDVVTLEMLGFGIPTNDRIASMFRTNSKLALGKIEGIVMKDYISRPQVFSKFLSPEYAEIRSNEKDPVAKYLTPSRVRKAYARLCEQGVIEDYFSESNFGINHRTHSGYFPIVPEQLFKKLPVGLRNELLMVQGNPAGLKESVKKYILADATIADVKKETGVDLKFSDAVGVSEDYLRLVRSTSNSD